MTTDLKNQFVDFWQERYDEQITPWDLGQVSPHFEQFLQFTQLPLGKMFVPGCGRAHDAAFFAEQGFDVNAVDYTKGAIEEVQRLYGHLENLTLEQQDIFHLPKSFTNKFDYLLEHTCYCAINPKRRILYARVSSNKQKSNLYHDVKEQNDTQQLVWYCVETR